MKKTRFTKSFIAILSASAMMALSSTAVFAADKSETPDTFKSNITSPTFKVGETPSATATCDVDIVVASKSIPTTWDDTSAKYKVDVAWESLTFTYTAGEWNTESHVYDGGTGWDKTEATISVTNHSNWGVVYTPSWATNSGAQNGVTATLSVTEAKKIAACKDGAKDSEVPKDTFTVNVEGIPTAAASFKLDTVKIEISPDKPTT